jgi:tetratricopeptide (TPR) repeat protein
MTRRAQPWLLLLLAATVLAFGLVAACARAPEGSSGSTDAGKPVDARLLAFLSRARSAHHIADQLEEDEELDRAVATLQGLVDGPAPGNSGADSPPEVREVLADTRARLADLKSQLGRFDDAASDVDKGLELAKETTYFRGHLFEVRGLVEERRSKGLKDKGEVDKAEAAKKRALDAFETSMTIQSEVIKSATEAGDAQ